MTLPAPTRWISSSRANAMASALRELSLHRYALALVVEGRTPSATPWHEGGVVLDALVSSELLVTLGAVARANPFAGGIVVVREGRIAVAGAHFAGETARFDPSSLDAVATRSVGTAICISEEDGHIWMASPRVPCRHVEPSELAEALKVLDD